MLCLLAALSVTIWGARPLRSAHDVVTMVYTSLYSDHDDARLAQELKKTRLSERLDPSLIRYFRGLHAGPKTLEALKSLSDRSQDMPVPAVPPEQIQPIPGTEEQASILGRLFRYAQSYVHGLPNFTCDQVTRRFTNFDPTTGSYLKTLRHSDTFTLSLGFVNGVEDRQVKQVNGKNAQTWKTEQGQSLSSGEFGRDMLITFGNQVEPKLAWNHWEMFDGKRQAVFSYFASARKTKFSLVYCCYLGTNGVKMQQTYNASVSGTGLCGPRYGCDLAADTASSEPARYFSIEREQHDHRLRRGESWRKSLHDADSRACVRSLRSAD